MDTKYYKWLDETYGLKPHLTEHADSFNNVLFSAELLLALEVLGGDSSFAFINAFLNHVMANRTIDGGYKPKDSHDNILGKIAGLKAIDDSTSKNLLGKMNVKELIKGKHPRDMILFSSFLSDSWWSKILMPFAKWDMKRAIRSSGKVRPSWTGGGKDFIFRLKVKLGIVKLVRTEEIFGGIQKWYKVGDGEERIVEVQNDGKILNLLRLFVMKGVESNKGFVRECKKMYIDELGVDFQSKLFANYFKEYEHPIRIAYRELDKKGLTIIDC